MANFAIIKTGGKQYKVREGDILKVEKLIGKSARGRSASGGNIEFKDLLSDKKISAKVLLEGKLAKVRVLKFKPKKRYKRIKGHRQSYSQIKIESIR